MDDNLDHLKKEISDRFVEARSALRMSPIELAEHLKCTAQTIRDYEKAKNVPGGGILSGLVKLGINANWLLAGLGSMQLNVFDCLGGSSTVLPPGNRLMAQEPSVDYVVLPRLPSDLSEPEMAESLVAEQAFVFRKAWLELELDAQPDDLSLFRMDNESMSPILQTGDFVLVNKRAAMSHGEGIYVLRLHGALLVKRLQTLPGNRLSVSSENPAYKTYTLKLSELPKQAIVGRVIWAGKRL